MTRTFTCALLAALISTYGVDPPRLTAEETATVTMLVSDADSGATMPARVHLKDASGRPVLPSGFPAWRDHFVIGGEADLPLSPGVYTYDVERGPEYSATQGDFSVPTAGGQSVAVALKRLVNLAAEGWYAGDMHVHRPLQDIELLMRAEDLHVAEVITWWNNANPWSSQPRPPRTIVQCDGRRFYDVMAGEDERGGGALLYFDLEEPLAIAGAEREYPSSVKFLREARRNPAAWIEAEKPFWWDLPLWIALGGVDSVGLAHNHLHRGGVLDSEAWGKPRDRDRFPPPGGVAFWTQEIYHHLLNCGLRIPPTAGSASGVLPNPLGYNRVYARVEGELTYAKWWEAVRQGRVFVTNGPLLRVTANGQLPGHVFRADAPISVQLQGLLDSREPITAVELVRNGQVERITLPSAITLHESGWFLIRAVADVRHTYRFASTSPFYAEIGGTPRPVRRASAQFFLDWVRERSAGLKLDDPAKRAEVLAMVRDAEAFWQAKLAEARPTATVRGRVVDSADGRALPARVYIQHADGRWFFPVSDIPGGTALRYERQNWINPRAIEYHTTLSADPFRVELEPGRYTFTVERGKEYRPLVREFDVGDDPLEITLPPERWVNMPQRGWYSGDTHVHRPPAELTNLMLAEDLNVAFPLSHWVTKAFVPPTQGDKGADAAATAAPVAIDPTHVYYPLNTEYEIFTVADQRHTLGAVFVLGHQTPLGMGAPPVGPIAEQAHREGALLDLDKHDWPWSMALIPTMGVDLYELANNHHWRTEFGITTWSSAPPEWMGLDTTEAKGGERDWTLYTFQNYYALLDCGFRLRPTAGTANGVHPVPLGFGRVYVHLPDGFSYDTWFKGLNAGHSFVTTGPMLLADVTDTEVSGTVLSEERIDAVEVIINGEVRHRLALNAEKNAEGAWEARFHQPIELVGTSWVALRAFEARADGRQRFAHTAPRWFDVPGQPLRPQKREAEFLAQRVRDQIDRSGAVLPPAAIAEYRKALEIYERIAEQAEP